MITMLKLHFYFSRKRLAFIGIFIAATILMFYHYSESFSLNTFLFIFLLQMASFGISLYNENNFIRILRTMPITTKDFITSAYVFTFIFIAVISLPILLHQFYQSKGVTADPYMPYIFLGFFAVSLVHMGMQLKHYFSNPTQNKVDFDLLNILFLLVVLFSPHSLLLLFFNTFFSIEMGGFIIPILSVWIYYKLCQSAITKFEQAEL